MLPDGIRGVLLDMDGVLYNSSQPIPGAVETMAWLDAQSIPHLFVTNTTSRGRSTLVKKLEAFGIPAKEADILTPPVAAAAWLKSQGARKVAVFVRPDT